MIEGTPLLNTANESTMDITFSNGSQIIFVSGEADISSLQGFVCKNNGMLVIDEAAYIKNDIIFALFPTTDVHRSKTILASTPRFRDGVFYEYFVRGENEDGNVYSYNWKGKTLLTEDKLEFYRKLLPENLFKNYYLGEWADFNASVFGDLSRCISDDYNPIYEPNNIFDSGLGCVMGVDWSAGTGNDETAIVLFNDNKEMIHLDHFNDLDETQTIDRIIDIIKQYKPRQVQVELNSIGRVFYGLLDKKINQLNIRTMLRGFNTSNDSKNKIVNNFQVAIQNDEVKILNNKRLITQLNNYTPQLTPSGKVTYNAPKGMNDDLVIATLLSYDLLSTGQYNII